MIIGELERPFDATAVSTGVSATALGNSAMQRLEER
jgi:hypothetical protein